MLIGLLILLNSIDAIATYVFLKQGIAREVNPIMASIWNMHPALFLWVKLCLVNTLLIRFYSSAENSSRNVAVIILLIMYGLITLQHGRILYYWLHS